MIVTLNQCSIPQAQSYLQNAIAPRPIALASTINSSGQVNLSPFSFYNVFSICPAIVIFSPSLSGRNGEPKHTLLNVQQVPQVVINVVDYTMVHQVSLSSCTYPQGVNEFEKAGFTPIPSLHIQPPRVAESLIQMECTVQEIKPLGNNAGAGQLVIAEVLCMHINDAVLTTINGVTQIDSTKINHVARLGANWYSKVDATNLFEVEKPNTQLGIGVDALPQSIRQSNMLTGNHLGQLANVQCIPTINPHYVNDRVKQLVQYYGINPTELETELHRYAAQLLQQNKVEEAWQVLLTLA